MCCPAPLSACGNHSGEAERDSGIGLKLFGFIPEPVFTFIPESCSGSTRNTVRNHPGIAFILSRNPHPHHSSIKRRAAGADRRKNGWSTFRTRVKSVRLVFRRWAGCSFCSTGPSCIRKRGHRPKALWGIPRRCHGTISFCRASANSARLRPRLELAHSKLSVLFYTSFLAHKE